MRVDSSQQTLRFAASHASPLLRLGAELQALVRRGSEGQLLLELEDGQLLAPRSSVPLRAGEQLQLRVAQVQPTTVLQILATQQADPPLQASLRALLSSAGSRSGLVASLAQLLDHAASSDSPAALRPLLTALAAHALQPEQLADAKQLTAALRESGLFLERRLLSEPQIPPEQDLKAQLLRLAARLQALASSNAGPDEPAANSPLAQLSDLTERLLTRLETLQLQAASSPRLDLFFELPMLGAAGLEALQLRIQEEHAREEGGGEDSAAGGLLVRLRFNFADDALGAVLRWAGSSMSVHWWAEQAATAARLQASLPLLADRLAALGLQVNEVHCLQGAPPALDELSVLRTRGLLDEKA